MALQGTWRMRSVNNIDKAFYAISDRALIALLRKMMEEAKDAPENTHGAIRGNRARD